MMRVTLCAGVCLFVGLLTPGACPAAATSQTFPITISCTSSIDEICSPSYTTPVTSTIPALLTVDFTSSPTNCSNFQIFISLDGGAIKTGGSSFLAPGGTTGQVPFGTISGTHTVAVTAVGQEGGCNDGSITSWGGTLALELEPLPTISSLSPGSATSGGPEFTLTVNGTGFAPGAQVTWYFSSGGGVYLPTNFVSATQLTTFVPALYIAPPASNPYQLASGFPYVNVVNPDTSQSIPFPFTVTSSGPAITSLSPNTTTQGGAAFTLTVNGTGFLSGATVQWNGSALSTIFVAATKLTASVPASLIVDSQSVNVTVLNPGGQLSTIATFTVSPTYAPATVTSLSPAMTIAGGAAFTLTVNGTGFPSGATVSWVTPSGPLQPVLLSTTFVSATWLTALVPASLIAEIGNATVYVIIPGGGPGGEAATSTAIAFPVNTPVPAITNLSPGSATAEGAPFTLMVNGAGFLSGATVLWNGLALNTIFVSGTQLTAPVPASLIAAAGSVSITVTDPGGSASSATTFSIAGPTLTITTTTLPGGAVNAAYAGAKLLAQGGTVPYNWTATGLPPGLTLSAGGALSGTPTTAGNYTPTFTVKDSSTPQLTAQSGLPIAIGAALTITTTTLPGGAVNAAYAGAKLLAQGGTVPYNWTATGLPPGLTLSAGGALSGTPTTAGNYTPTFTVKDSSTPQLAAQSGLPINITGGQLTVTSSALPGGVVDAPFAGAALAVQGGTPPYNWTATALPPGLTVTAEGTLSGTPATAGNYTPTFMVTDSSTPQLTAQLGLMIAIAGPAPSSASTADEIIRVFPTTTPQPDPASSQFIQVADTLSSGASPTRTVVINGIDLVFDSSISNGLWAAYNGLTGITNMTINARSVTFRSLTTLPGTNVSITAQTLQFQGSGALTTTPSAPQTPPSQIGAPGLPGQPGGNVTLQIASFISDPATPNPLVLSGGPGGAPGPGAPGANGTSLQVQTNFGQPSQAQNNDNIPNNSMVCIDYQVATMDKENPVHVAYYGSCNSLPGYPTNGSDATPAGIPGLGGSGGNLTSTIDVHTTATMAGGLSAPSLGTYPGGQAGTPTVSAWCVVAFNVDGGPYWGLWPNTGIVTTTSGKTASSPSASAPQGAAGAYTALAATGWATAAYATQRLAYATALYQTNYFQQSTIELDGIVSDLASSLSSQETSENVAALLGQANQLLARLAANLNYFSMQQNFAPLTTLELNAAAYSQEIKADVNLLYLQAVVQSATMTLQEKLAAIQAQTQSLKTDIANQTATINTALTSLATLNGESLQDEQALSQYAADVQAINAEQQIQAQGDLENAALQNKTSLFGTIAKIAVGIAGLVPALAPLTPIINAVSGIEAAATGSAGSNTIPDISGLAPVVAAATASCLQLTIEPPDLQSPMAGTPYTGPVLTVVGGIGTRPFFWTAMGLPMGELAMDPDTGVISGTPKTAGTFAVTIAVKDSSSPQQASGQLEVYLIVNSNSGSGGTSNTPTTTSASHSRASAVRASAAATSIRASTTGGSGSGASASTSLGCVIPNLQATLTNSTNNGTVGINAVVTGAAAIGTIVAGIAQTESSTSISGAALDAEVAKIQQQDPILGQLAAANTNLTTANMNLQTQMDQANQTIQTAVNQIVSDLLSINSFDTQLSSTVLALSPDTVNRVNQLATNARNRLEWYQQLLLASQQYVQLAPSSVSLDLSHLQQSVNALIVAGGPAVPSDATIAAEVDLFEQDLANVTQNIISYYTGHYPSSRASFGISLTPDQILALNSGQDLIFNPVAAGIVPQGATNVRVAGIQVPTLDLVAPAGNPTVANLQLLARFPGVGRISSGGHIYEFFFYPSNNPNPVEFGATKDLITGTLSPIIPSPAAVSLLETIVGAASDTDPFTTLPADANFVLHVQSNTNNNAPLTIKDAVLQVTLDYVPQQPAVVDVQIASPANLAMVGFGATADSFQRAAGSSPAVREYSSGTTVTITAPPQVGQMLLQGYDDGRGNFLTKNLQFSAPVNTSITVRPVYVFSPLFISCSPSVGPAVASVVYQSTCYATGGTQPYTWSITSGSLPGGLTLTQNDARSATIAGITSVLGAYTFTLTATDSSPSPSTGFQSFTGTVSAAPPVIANIAPASAAAQAGSAVILVNGSGFGQGDFINWNGIALATAGVGPNQLSATLSPGLLAFPGSAIVTVTSAALPAFTSNSKMFAITPGNAGLSTYYFPHLAVGGGFQTTLTYVNYSQETVSCQTSFYSDSGASLQLPFPDGAVSSRSDFLAPGAEIHVQTTAAINATALTGWAETQCTSAINASILYRLYNGITPVGEVSVLGTTVPATGFVTFAQTETGVAFANPSSAPVNVSVTALNSFGAVLGTKSLTLPPNGHTSANVGPLLGVSSFTGSVRIQATAPIASLSVNAEAFPVISSLPPGDLPVTTSFCCTPVTYYFPHIAVGGGYQTTLTYVNYSPGTVSCQTTFYSDSGTALQIPFPDGVLSSRSDSLAPGGDIHIQTTAASDAGPLSGWAQTQCTSAVNASILFRLYNGSTAVGEASVNGTTAPTTEFVTFAQTATAVAFANPSETPAVVTITALDSLGGLLGSTSLTLPPNGHTAANIGPLLGISTFTGSAQMQSTSPIVSLSLNAEAFPVFSSLPTGALPASTSLAQQ